MHRNTLNCLITVIFGDVLSWTSAILPIFVCRCFAEGLSCIQNSAFNPSTKENEVLYTETKSIRYMAVSILSRLRKAAGAQKGCWSATEQPLCACSNQRCTAEYDRSNDAAAAAVPLQSKVWLSSA